MGYAAVKWEPGPATRAKLRLRGNPGMSPTSAMDPLPATSEPTLTSPVLTPAERRVLHMLKDGRSNKGIAAALTLSHRTVESHVSHLLAKTGCNNRSQLLLWALGER